MRFVTESGAFLFSVGASVTDVRAEQIVTLEGDVTAYRQREVVVTAVEIGYIACGMICLASASPRGATRVSAPDMLGRGSPTHSVGCEGRDDD